MSTPRVAELIGLLDADTRALLGLQIRGIPGAAGAVDMSAYGGVTSVAGLTGVVSTAGLAQALALAQEETWAHLKTRAGAYSNELLALPKMDGVVGGRVFVYWSTTLNRWRPLGRQCLGKLAKVTGSAGTTFGVTIPNFVCVGGPWWPDTTLQVVTKLVATNNGSTSAPFHQSIGGNSWIADTQQPSRRKAFSRELEIFASGAGGQLANHKTDNDYGPFSNQNNAGFSFGIDTTADFTIASDTGAGWVNAASSTLTLQKMAVYWDE